MNIEDLKNLAILSKLKIEDYEIEKILKDMTQIIDFANKINSAEIEEDCSNNSKHLQNVFRKDEVEESYSQEEILKNAKTKEDGFFYLNNVEKIGGNKF